MKKNREPNNTIDDVARHAGVSIKTVSRVLNQRAERAAGDARQGARDRAVDGLCAEHLGAAARGAALVHRRARLPRRRRQLLHPGHPARRARRVPRARLQPAAASLPGQHRRRRRTRSSSSRGSRCWTASSWCRRSPTRASCSARWRARACRSCACRSSTAASCRRRSRSATAPGPIKWLNISRGSSIGDIAFIVGNENQGASIDRLRGYQRGGARLQAARQPGMGAAGRLHVRVRRALHGGAAGAAQAADRGVREQRRHGGRRAAGRAPARLRGAGRPQHRRVRRHLAGAARCGRRSRPCASRSRGRRRSRPACCSTACAPATSRRSTRRFRASWWSARAPRRRPGNDALQEAPAKASSRPVWTALSFLV